MPDLTSNDFNKDNTIVKPEKGSQDMGREDYVFEPGKNDVGVEIDGFLFFPDEVKGDESFARREFKRTKIMGGGEYVSRGQYIPKEFSFKTTLTLDEKEPYMYDRVLAIMENKPCEVVSPYMCGIFTAEVQIDKTHPKAAPHVLELDIKVKEIVKPNTITVGDDPIIYPSANTISDYGISVKQVQQQKSDELATENAQSTNSGRDYDNPYK